VESVPLTLITGPANAAKAGVVLERLRAALPHEPLLVVPTAADAEHYGRELAAEGIVFGAEVLTFSRLVRALAAAAGVSGRPLGTVARDRLVRAAVRDTPLRVLAASAAAPGFAAAAGELFAELGRSLVTPQRFTSALRAWAASGTAPAHAEELAALHAAYHRRLRSIGAIDAEGFARAALDGLRERPAAWAARPVLLYGFDDLTPLQLDTVETLAGHAGADVCVALPYEPGRAAFAGRAATVELLKPLAAQHLQLPDRSEHYAGAARAALHHLERRLFEPGGERCPPNGAVRLLEAGGERAEAELVAAEVLELMREGVAPEDIAVLARGSRGTEVLARGLAEYDVPVAPGARVDFDRTRLGAGVLSFARAALPGGTATDVLTWLRTPGKLADPDAADALEARVRRAEAVSVADARRLWRAAVVTGEDPFTRLDELAEAAADGTPSFLDALLAEAAAIWTAPHVRRGAVLGREDASDARAVAALRAAAAELRSLAAADPELLAGDHGILEVLDALKGVPVREERAGAHPGGVLVAEPLDIRARRFRAVFVCALQDGEFPRRPAPEPFLDDDARAELARASGLVLRRHEDALGEERYLFYACVSRPEEVLYLSFRSSDEEGDPATPSPFVDDVRALFGDGLWDQRGTRLLAEVTWPPAAAPTPHELQRTRAAAEREPEPPPLAPPATDAVHALLDARGPEPARALETFAACGVRWLVEGLLRPDRVEPDPEPMRRGSLAHAVLERTLRGLREREGTGRLTPGTVDAALAELDTALDELRASRGRELAGARGRAALRDLEEDLRRYLLHEAECGAGLEPKWLEWSFGGEHDAHGPLPLNGSGFAVTGRVDRIDVDGDGRAVVRDYKGRNVTAGARWAQDGRIQAALYALAARELLGLDPAGALYQPLGRGDRRPRGLVVTGTPGRYVGGDVVEVEALDTALDEARTLALDAARAMHAGRIRPCPSRCSPKGCAYPGICRAGEESEGEAGASTDTGTPAGGGPA
jgi:ATP-dependent helicase/DNAse subunit B